MKAASLHEIRHELKNKTQKELTELCLRLGRFKKDNKELLTYLLFESQNEADYINMIKLEIDETISELNTTHIYFAKKSLRKLLRQLNKYVRYSGNKQTQVEVLLHFCQAMNHSGIAMDRSVVILNMYERQKAKIRKTLGGLHEDLQADYLFELERLD
jgi:hypothetical protein